MRFESDGHVVPFRFLVVKRVNIVAISHELELSRVPDRKLR